MEGTDGVFQEFLKNLEDLAKQWLLDFYKDILLNGDILNDFLKIQNIRFHHTSKAGRKPVQLQIHRLTEHALLL